MHFIHCARHGGVHAFRDVDRRAGGAASATEALLLLRASATAISDAHGIGFVDETLLATWLPENRDVDAYFLGPKPFMKAVKTHLKALGVPEAQSRYEFFGPASALD